MTLDIIVVNLLKEVCSAMEVKNPESDSNLVINYDAGRNPDIMRSLIEKDQSTSQRYIKYPLVAAKMPFKETLGSGLRKVKIDRIVFATLTRTEQEFILPRFAENEAYDSVLLPCYKEFLKQLAYSRWTSCGDPDAYSCDVKLNPGQQPIGEGLTDFVDTLEILNLEFYLNQIKNC